MSESNSFVFFNLVTPFGWLSLAASVVLLAFSVIAFRHRHGVDTVLLLIGSLALFSERIFWGVFMAFLAGYHLDHPESQFASIFYPGDASAPWTSHVAVSLFLLSLLLVPAGIVFYFIRVARIHLTRRWSERRTVVRSALK